MTGEVCGALPAEATRSGARESPWQPHQEPVPYFLASPHLLVRCRRAPRAHVRSVSLGGLRQYSGSRRAIGKSMQLQRWHAARLLRRPCQDHNVARLFRRPSGLRLRWAGKAGLLAKHVAECSGSIWHLRSCGASRGRGYWCSA